MYKIRKLSALRDLNSEQLRSRLQEINETQILLRTQKENLHAVNPGQWKSIKKEKARILTILGERFRMENGKQKGGFRKRWKKR